MLILDEQIFLNPNYSEKRVNFLLAGLHALDEDLRRLGSRLIIRRGDPVVEHNFARQRAMATNSGKKDFPKSMHTL